MLEDLERIEEERTAPPDHDPEDDRENEEDEEVEDRPRPLREPGVEELDVDH